MTFFEKTLHTKCLRCNRKLKNPKWQEIGMGKRCIEKTHKGSTVVGNGVQLAVDEFVEGDEKK